MKRMFGTVEAVFDILYLAAALILGAVLLGDMAGNQARILAGAMALVLAFGDAFHLIPRIIAIFTGQEERLRPALGRGKQITSITMTVFYLLLWQIGGLAVSPPGELAGSYIVYLLAAVRIALCLLPQNEWQQRYPPVGWAVLRNLPFFLLGVVVAVQFYLQRSALPGLGPMWLAIALSFGFYLPVVLYANRNPKVGMLMLPKTCAYLWMLTLCLSL